VHVDPQARDAALVVLVAKWLTPPWSQQLAADERRVLQRALATYRATQQLSAMERAMVRAVVGRHHGAGSAEAG
jgi:hypothetical protein